MAGLLSSRNRGLLGAFQDRNRPGMTTADRLRGLMVAPPQEQAPAPARQGLLDTVQPQAPQRERVSLWRTIDGVLGGSTISESLDSERARLTGEAMAPMEAQQRQAIASTIEDPRELALFLQDPEAWSKNVGQQYAPQVIAAGSGQAIGGRITSEMPSYTESGDQILRRDSQGVQPVFTRTAPSISEGIASRNADTAELTARRPIGVSPGEVIVDPQTGRQMASGAPRVFSAADATQLYTEDGSMLAENTRDAPTGGSPDAMEAQRQISAIDTDIFPTLDRQVQLLRSGDVITGFGATARLTADRALAATGDRNAARRVAATEEYINNSGRLRVGMAKSLGANPSNADITLLERVTAGDIGQSQEGLLATITQGRSLAERQRAAYATRAQPQAQQAPAPQGGVVMVRSPQEAAALPPGTQFRTPDGRVLVRQ